MVKRGDVFVRLNGVNPAHKSCADNRGLNYTVGMDVHPSYMASGLTPRAADEGDSQPPIYVFSVRDLSTKKGGH